ncbi:unnamed protein product [Callosobruchus maculatus]|uniref:Uncharacterized protein n=1 Tax=Callosobruchus maculatus TaxID=64391 RepID=A0A653C4L1_CALMS|nr:unnamed protein product [Callosobruchus maculatus]
MSTVKATVTSDNTKVEEDFIVGETGKEEEES